MPSIPKINIPLHHISTKDLMIAGFNVIDLKGPGGRNYDSAVPHRHNFYELLFFQQGSGLHEIDFQKYPIENNSVHFVSPGQIHRLVSTKAKGFVLCFNEDFVVLNSRMSLTDVFPFFNPDNKLAAVKLSKGLGKELQQIIVSVAREFKGRNEVEIQRAYLNIILFKIKRHISGNRPGATSAINDKKSKITLFKKMLDNEFIAHKAVSDYAGKLRLSPNHLNALCKKHTGKTAIQVIQERVLLEARRLLYATEMNIKEISFELGFEDVAYFNRFFKKHVKITPLQYRQAAVKNH